VCVQVKKTYGKGKFIQVLMNLRGYDVRRCIINEPNASWIDQWNTFVHLHVLEKKIFERSIEFFFDTAYSCMVLDDKMIGSKASDVESKIVSGRKAAGEAPTTDCFCDSFFQFVLGIQIKTVSDAQLMNVKKLVD
jgi:hypothetical protein